MSGSRAPPARRAYGVTRGRPRPILSVPGVCQGRSGRSNSRSRSSSVPKCSHVPRTGHVPEEHTYSFSFSSSTLDISRRNSQLETQSINACPSVSYLSLQVPGQRDEEEAPRSTRGAWYTCVLCNITDCPHRTGRGKVSFSTEVLS